VKSALLVIDMQKAFWDIEVAEAFKDVPGKAARLLAGARKAGVEVIHLRVQFKADRSDWPPNFMSHLGPLEGNEGVKVLPFAVEEVGEKVFIKNSFDGFASTPLEAYLRERGIGMLYACGFVTSICVNLTCATAHQKGFKTVLVEDCCGDYSLERHNFTLDTYKVISFRAKPLDEVLIEMGAS